MTLTTSSIGNKADFYSQHIQSWQQSGISQEKYCQSANISYAAFVYWRVKFLAKNIDKIKQKFIPMVSKQPTPNDIQMKTVEHQKIKVLFPNGIELSCPMRSLNSLADYLKAL